VAKTRHIQSAFTSGVLSPLLKGRIDLGQYYQGLETGDDWVLLPQGGIRRRPGTNFLQKAVNILSRSTVVPTMPNGGTAANINDDNDSTTAVTTTNVSTLDPYVVAKYDLGASSYIEVVDVRGIFLTTNTSIEFVIQHSDDDITFTTAATVPLIGTAAQDFRLAVRATKRYWRLARIGSTDLGTDKVTLAEFNLMIGTSNLSGVKLRDFSIESDRNYLLSFTDGNCRIFRKETGLHVADIKVPFLTGEVKTTRDTQVESVMLIFHEDHATVRIINLGTDTDWSTDAVPYINVPQFDFDDVLSPTPTSEVQVMTFVAFVPGDTFQIDIEGVLSKNITFAGSTAGDEQTSTAENIRKNIQDMPVVGETGVSVVATGGLIYTITIADGSAKAFKLFSAFATSGTGTKTITFTQTTEGVPRKEDIWSVLRGFPKTACFYDGRLILGGTKSKTQSIFASKAGVAFDFDLGEGDVDEAIFITISSRKLNSIVDVFPGRDLQIFTSGSEFTIPVRPITPQNITIAPQTSHGSLNLEAKEIDGATIFADRNGKSIKEYLFSFQENAYTTQDASVLSPELIKSPVDLAILGGTASDDANWIFMVNNDGSATILNTLRAQDINGFTRWTTSGFITDVSVVDDELYMVNKRTVGGVESNFIERWDFDHYVDNGLTLTNSAPLNTLPGLDHLEGQLVKVAAIDPTNPLGVIILADRTVSGGAIALTSDEEQYTKIQVGLPFNPILKPMPLSTNIGSGPNAMRIKKIVRMNLRIKDASGLTVDGRPLPDRFFDSDVDSPLDSFPKIKTGVINDILPTLGWGIDEMPTIELTEATPCIILAIEYEVESS